MDVRRPYLYYVWMELYHVLNRGVEKRTIVTTDSDRLRFVHSLYVFNDAKAVNPNHRHRDGDNTTRQRDVLVHIHAWCLMDNHYHLLISPINDDTRNLSLFMKKLNGGYAKYFNEKYKRSGYLWQGKYKKIHISSSAHELYIPYYIHLNPLDFSMPEWRSGQITDLDNALNKLEKYRWSSHPDYLGTHNFPSIIYRKLLQPIFESPKSYLKQVKQIISLPEIASRSAQIEFE